MKKQFLCILISFALCSLTACGNTRKPAVEQDTSLIAEQESSAAVEARTTEATAEELSSAVESQTIESETDEETTLIYLESKTVFYDSDGAVFGTSEIEYDDKGNETKLINYSVDGAIIYFNEIKYEYDSKGNKIKATSYNANGDIRYSSEYDKNGNETRLKYHGDGAVNCSYEWEYDDKGSKTKMTVYDADYPVSSTCEYEYDAKGNLVKSIDTLYTYLEDASYTKITYTEYEYDKQGNMVKTITYQEESDKTLVWENQYEYDYNENIVKNERYYYGVLDLIQEIEYNDDDMKIREKSSKYDENGSAVISICETEYDENGNRIKMTTYDADGTILSTEEYEYIELQVPKR